MDNGTKTYGMIECIQSHLGRPVAPEKVLTARGIAANGYEIIEITQGYLPWFTHDIWVEMEDIYFIRQGRDGWPVSKYWERMLLADFNA